MISSILYGCQVTGEILTVKEVVNSHFDIIAANRILLTWKILCIQIQTLHFFYKNPLYKELWSRSLLNRRNSSTEPNIFRKLRILFLLTSSLFVYSTEFSILNTKIYAPNDNKRYDGAIQQYNSKVDQYRVLLPDGADGYIKLNDIDWIKIILEDWILTDSTECLFY